MIAIDLSKQQALSQQATIFFLVKKAKETVLDFSQGSVKLF